MLLESHDEEAGYVMQSSVAAARKNHLRPAQGYEELWLSQAQRWGHHPWPANCWGVLPLLFLNDVCDTGEAVLIVSRFEGGTFNRSLKWQLLPPCSDITSTRNNIVGGSNY